MEAIRTAASASPPAAAPAWVTGWTAQAPLQLDYHFVPASTLWVPGPLEGLEHRDLGVAEASKGKMSARLVRAKNPSAIPTEWRALETDFHFMYVLKGNVKLENVTGQRLRLERGAAAWQPSFLRHRMYDYSSDFEMFEMLAPADPNIFWGKDVLLPDRAKEFAHMHGQYLAETPDSYVQGAGPRKFFKYRDLETTGASEGRIHIHVVQATDPMPGGTGWHTHSMRQLFVVIDGHAGFEVEGHPEIKRVDKFDAVCVHAGQRHDVPSFSADYKVLEICMPAEYTTVATDPPVQKA